MLLIDCPWCGPRERDRVLLRRRGAHRAARRHRRADRRAVGRLPVHAQEPARRAPRAVGARVRLPALVQRRARHRDLPDHAPSTRSASAASRGAGSSDDERERHDRIACRRRPHRPRARRSTSRSTARATRAIAGDTLASALLANGVVARRAAAASTTARAASSAAASRSPTRWCSSRPAPAPCPTRARPRSSSYEGLRRAQRQLLAERRLRPDGGQPAASRASCRPASTTRRSCGRKRFWMTYEHYIRKASAASARAPTAARSRPLRQDERPLRRAGRRRRARPGSPPRWPAGKAGARVILADEQAELGGSLLRRDAAQRDRRPMADRGAAAGSRRRVAELAAMPEVRLLPRTTVFGYHDHNFLTIAERRDRSSAAGDSARARASALWRVRAKQVVLATGAHRAAAGLRQQRPARHHAGLGGVRPTCNRYARAAGIACRRLHQQRQRAIGPRSTSPTPASRWRRSSTRARRRAGALAERARAAGIEVIAGAVVVDATRRQAGRGVDVHGARRDGDGVAGAAAHARLRPAGRVGRLEPGRAPALRSRAASRASTTRTACFVPGDAGAGRALGRRVPTAASRSRECLAEGVAAGAAAARRAGFGDGAASPTPDRRRRRRGAARAAVAGAVAARHRAAGPSSSSTCRTTSPPPTSCSPRAKAIDSIEHVKRYTAMGFGTDQGKLGNINGMAILAQALGQDDPAASAPRPSARTTRR